MDDDDGTSWEQLAQRWEAELTVARRELGEWRAIAKQLATERTAAIDQLRAEAARHHRLAKDPAGNVDTRLYNEGADRAFLEAVNIIINLGSAT